jgi:hypothetical protein
VIFCQIIDEFVGGRPLVGWVLILSVMSAYHGDRCFILFESTDAQIEHNFMILLPLNWIKLRSITGSKFFGTLRIKIS